jgi:hypothetical protein
VSEERQRVLRMLKEGKVTVEEVEALLDALGETGGEPVSGQAPGASGGEAPREPGGTESTGGSSGAASDRRGEFHRLLDDIMRAVDVEGIKESVRESLRRSRVDVDRVKEEVLRATDRVREETWRTAREYRRHGWGRVSRTIEGLWGMTPSAGTWAAEADLGPGRRVVVQNIWGDVKVEGGPDDRLRATAVIRAWGRDEADAASLRTAISIAVEDDGAAHAIRVEPPAGGLPRRYRVDFSLQVPAGSALEISHAKGDVAVAGVTGDVDVEARHGDVVIDTGGAVRVDLMHGDVAVSGARGRVEIHTMHGDIRLARTAGTIVARSKHGDVALGAPAGPVEFDLETARGDLHAEVEEFATGVSSRMRAMHGDVSVRLRAQAGCRISARVTSGEIQAGQAFPDQQGRRTLSGVYGSGGASLDLSTMSGDISIDADPLDVPAGTNPRPA